MEIRRLRAEEWSRWRDLRLELLADAPDAFGSTYADSLTQPDAFWQERVERAATSEDSALFVAEDGAEWVATAGVYTEDEAPDDVCVVSVWTRPSARGRGIQGRVIEALMDWARERGRRRVTLWVARRERAGEALLPAPRIRPDGPDPADARHDPGVRARPPALAGRYGRTPRSLYGRRRGLALPSPAVRG